MKKQIVSSAKAIKEEISLSLLIVSFILIMVTGILQVFKRVDSTGPFMNLFLTCGGLYFGRSWVKQTANNKENEEKVNEK